MEHLKFKIGDEVEARFWATDWMPAKVIDHSTIYPYRVEFKHGTMMRVTHDEIRSPIKEPVNAYNFLKTIPANLVLKLAKQCKGGIQFLIDEGFIEQVIERPDFKMDDPVMVRDYYNMGWERRNFCVWSKDKIHCWVKGKTSKTTNEIITWNYWKKV